MLNDYQIIYSVYFKLNKERKAMKIKLTKSLEQGVLIQDDITSSYKHLIVCETVTQFDKKRIYLHSSVQVVNCLDIDFDLKLKKDKKDYSIVLKPGRKTFIPLDFIKTNEFNIRPIE